MRILIAEDDLVLADGLLRTLRASGAVADHVASGTEADAALMTTDEFDLLILDLGLPKMHGLEVLKRLRARGSSPYSSSPRPTASRSASRVSILAPTTTWPNRFPYKSSKPACAPLPAVAWAAPRPKSSTALWSMTKAGAWPPLTAK